MIELFKEYFDKLLSEGIILQRGNKYFVADDVTDVNDYNNLLNENLSTKENTQENEIINLLKEQVAFLKSEINHKSGIISDLISKIAIPPELLRFGGYHSSGVIEIWGYHSNAIIEGRKFGYSYNCKCM